MTDNSPGARIIRQLQGKPGTKYTKEEIEAYRKRAEAIVEGQVNQREPIRENTQKNLETINRLLSRKER